MRGGDGDDDDEALALHARLKVGFYFALWYALNGIYNSEFLHNTQDLFLIFGDFSSAVVSNCFSRQFSLTFYNYFILFQLNHLLKQLSTFTLLSSLSSLSSSHE